MTTFIYTLYNDRNGTYAIFAVPKVPIGTSVARLCVCTPVNRMAHAFQFASLSAARDKWYALVRAGFNRIIPENIPQHDLKIIREMIARFPE